MKTNTDMEKKMAQDVQLKLSAKLKEAKESTEDEHINTPGWHKAIIKYLTEDDDRIRYLMNIALSAFKGSNDDLAKTYADNFYQKEQKMMTDAIIRRAYTQAQEDAKKTGAFTMQKFNHCYWKASKIYLDSFDASKKTSVGLNP